jgi:hypothetical protein
VALTHRDRSAAVGAQHEDLLRRGHGRGACVGQVLLVRKLCVAAAHEGEAGAVVAEGETGQLLPVIVGEGGELASRLAARRDPDVAYAGFVLDLCEARHITGAGKVARHWQREGCSQSVAVLRESGLRKRQADDGEPEANKHTNGHAAD